MLVIVLTANNVSYPPPMEILVLSPDMKKCAELGMLSLSWIPTHENLAWLGLKRNRKLSPVPK